MAQSPTLLGRVGSKSLWLILPVVLAAAGCASTGVQEESVGGPTALASQQQTRSAVPEEPSDAQPEDTGAPEPAAAGGGAVSVELAGLPVGGGSAASVRSSRAILQRARCWFSPRRRRRQA